MSLTMIEQLKTQEEASLTDMLDLAYSHSAAQTLDDANIAADNLLNNFTENELEDQEEIDALDSTEDDLDVDDTDLTETDDGGELGNARSFSTCFRVRYNAAPHTTKSVVARTMWKQARRIAADRAGFLPLAVRVDLDFRGLLGIPEARAEKNCLLCPLSDELPDELHCEDSR